MSRNDGYKSGKINNSTPARRPRCVVELPGAVQVTMNKSVNCIFPLHTLFAAIILPTSRFLYKSVLIYDGLTSLESEIKRELQR